LETFGVAHRQRRKISTGMGGWQMGGRWLITKHRAVEVLKRLHARQRDICELSIETTFNQRVPHTSCSDSDAW